MNMKKIAHIVLPPHMTPALAQTLGEALAAEAGMPDIGGFLSLSLLFQSWQYSQEMPLEAYCHALGTTVLRADNLDPLVLLGDPETYARSAQEHSVPRLEAVQAAHAAIKLANQLGLYDLGSLQVDTAEALDKVLSRDIEAARSLFNLLHEEIFRSHPPLGSVNEMLLWDDVPAARSVSESSSAQVPDMPAPAAAVPTLLLSPDGKPLGLFESREAAAQFVFRHLMGRAGTSPAAPAETPAVERPALDPSKPSFRVFDGELPAKKLKVLGPPGIGDGNSQQRKLLELMAGDAGLRELTEVPEGNPLQSLYESFPHFTEVLDFVAQSLALAGCGEEGHPVRIPPILLRGDAGTGKTHFSQELARALGAHFVERDLSVTSEAFVISGMDSAWKGSKPGVVFETLVYGKTANPVILLNEVDKCTGRGSHNSPISSLYSLLEPTSSTHFVDEFAQVEINASQVVWVLTANHGEIPDPILSRLEVFDIRKPNQEECRMIAQSVWRSVVKHTLPRGHGFAKELSPVILEALSQMSPRVMRKALTHAAGTAARANRCQLLLEDLQTSQKRYAAEPVRRSMGFVSQ